MILSRSLLNLSINFLFRGELFHLMTLVTVETASVAHTTCFIRNGIRWVTSKAREDCLWRFKYPCFSCKMFRALNCKDNCRGVLFKRKVS